VDGHLVRWTSAKPMRLCCPDAGCKEAIARRGSHDMSTARLIAEGVGYRFLVEWDGLGTIAHGRMITETRTLTTGRIECPSGR